MAIARRRYGAQKARAASTARRRRGASDPALGPPPASSQNEEEPPIPGLYEVNERCIEMLIDAARNGPGGSFPLVSELRELLKSLQPAARQRAARRPFLLTEMEFDNLDYWRITHSHPARQIRLPAWRGSFPHAPGTQLARATLHLAWNGLRADASTAPLVLGMSQPVSEVIASLTFDEIDRIAEKQFRHVRPRWDDRPAQWRRLFLAAQAPGGELSRQFNLHALQLLTAEFVPSSG